MVVFDNLGRGNEEALDQETVKLVVGDLRNVHEVQKLFEEGPFEAVLHFAAYALVGESMEKPEEYFTNNVGGSLNLLRAMVQSNVKNFILSSTSEVYGEAKFLPITEDHPLEPTNPYGESKLMVEKVLKWLDKIHDLRFVSLRYFNAAGAMLDGSLGEAHDPETHLIANAIRGALGIHQFKLTYSRVHTPDGSTIRDYIHVEDLADAHILALRALENGAVSNFYNVGVGKGYSTLEIVEEIRRVAGGHFEVGDGERRHGEPAEKYASNEKIKRELGWEPKYGLKEIIESAYRWHSSKKKEELE